MTTAKDMSAQGKIERYRRTHAAMEQERSGWVAQWRDLADYMAPYHARFQASDANRGDKNTRSIIDNTGFRAARVLAAGLMSGVTTPSRTWFRLALDGAPGEQPATVRRWLSECESRMRGVFIRSNLYNQLPNVYMDLGVFGTSALGALEDDDDALRFYHFPVGSYMIGNNKRQVVDCFVREFTLTARQAAEAYGKDMLSAMTRQLLDSSQAEQRVGFCQMILPADDAIAGGHGVRGMRYRSCVYESPMPSGSTATQAGADASGAAGMTVVHEGGFDSFPVLVPRWATTGEDAYGRSPGMLAIGDTKALQHLQRVKAFGIEMQANPPMVGPAALRQHQVSLFPGGVTYVDDTQQGQLRPVHAYNFPISGVMQDVGEHQQRINATFFVDLFLMLANSDRREITAEEIRAKQDEKLMALGPVLERLNDELLDPLINRAWDIMVRRGLIPPPPSEIQGRPIRVEYVSILAQAQKMLGLGALDRFVGTVGNMAQADPQILDKINRDRLVDHYADALGVPPDSVLDASEVAEIRALRRQAQAQDAAAQQVETLTRAAQGAKLLSETDAGRPSALSQILGGG